MYGACTEKYSAARFSPENKNVYSTNTKDDCFVAKLVKELDGRALLCEGVGSSSKLWDFTLKLYVTQKENIGKRPVSLRRKT